MGYGGVGLATVVGVLMVLAPATSGVLVHRNTVLSAPYKGTVWSPNSNLYLTGCSSAKAAKPLWNPSTGAVSIGGSGAAKTCPKSLAGVGTYSSGDAGSGINLAIPFKVASNGNHSVAASWTITGAMASAFTAGACPGWSFSYPPASGTYQYGYCEAGADVSVYIDSYVVDMNNASWYGNYSYLDSYNDSFFENYTDCYNYSTPTCYNTSGTFNYAFTYGYNKAGSVTWGSPSALMMWTNGTNMVKTHHYVLEVYINAYTDAFAEYYHTKAHWTASASASLNLATLGNGAVLGSVTIA